MIYLDHNATTPLLPEVWEEMQRVTFSAPGNPSSRHAAGRLARKALEDAREQIAEVLDAAPEEVVFTSGGTESINLALRGLASKRSGSIVLPPGEHSATTAVVAQLQQQGHSQQLLLLDPAGQLRADSLSKLDWQQVSLATAMYAHNETGVVQNLQRLREQCEKHGVPWHVDAVQAVGKIRVGFRALGCTAMSLGAHKFYGPRGVGALLVRRDVPLPPCLWGAQQESGRRPGTEPVALIAGMAAALRIWRREEQSRFTYLRGLRDQLAGSLRAFAPLQFHGGDSEQLPNTLSVAFPGCRADALVVALDLQGICCSIGSACASGSTQPAPVLLAMGISAEVAAATIRLSVGVTNTRAEIESAACIIGQCVNRLRAL